MKPLALAAAAFLVLFLAGNAVAQPKTDKAPPVQIDLDKLPPELAKRLLEELNKPKPAAPAAQPVQPPAQPTKPSAKPDKKKASEAPTTGKPSKGKEPTSAAPEKKKPEEAPSKGKTPEPSKSEPGK